MILFLHMLLNTNSVNQYINENLSNLQLHYRFKHHTLLVFEALHGNYYLKVYSNMAHKENLADKNFSNNLISATLTD